MWSKHKAEQILGQKETIDKLELVKTFLTSQKETPLTNHEVLTAFLRGIDDKTVGVYCIYGNMSGEVLDIGKSKNLRSRIRQQLIGSVNRKDKNKPRKFTRLFFAFLQKQGTSEKEYNASTDLQKKEYISSYQDYIFNDRNFLRVVFTQDHLDAIVLEYVLIEYFKAKGQCDLNFQF